MRWQFSGSDCCALRPGICSACSCSRQSVQAAYGSADIVFEGRIASIEGSITPGTWPAGTVRFKVSRVWKGEVPTDFEMPAVMVGSSCLGFYRFLLKPQNELLVYARLVAWTPRAEKGYFTDACARTQVLKNAKEDLRILQAISERAAKRPGQSG